MGLHFLPKQKNACGQFCEACASSQKHPLIQSFRILMSCSWAGEIIQARWILLAYHFNLPLWWPSTTRGGSRLVNDRCKRGSLRARPQESLWSRPLNSWKTPFLIYLQWHLQEHKWIWCSRLWQGTQPQEIFENWTERRSHFHLMTCWWIFLLFPS